MDFKVLNYLLIAFVLYSIFLSDFNQPLISKIDHNISSYYPWFWFTSLLPVLSDKQKTYINQFLIFISSITAVIICLQLINLIPILPFNKVYGFHEQPFTSAGILLITIFFTINQLSGLANNSLKSYYSLSLIAQIIAIIALGQRSVLLGLLVAGIIYLISRKKVKTILFTLLGLVPTVYIISAFSVRFKRRFSGLLSNFSELFSKAIGCRLELWQLNLEAFWQKPLLGTDIVPMQCQKTMLNTGHSIFIHQLVTKGLIGSFIWLSFYLAIVWTLFKELRHGSLAFLCLMLALSIEGFFEFWWGDIEVFGVFVYCIAHAIISCYGKRVK